jgi:hypothetical protein
MKNKPRTYEATKARWNDPASREAAAARMRELHRLAKVAREHNVNDGVIQQPFGTQEQDRPKRGGR